MELRHFLGELFAAESRKSVVAGAAISGSDAPLGRNPTFNEHALEGGIKGTLLDLKDVFGDPLDGIGDFVAVHLAGAGQGFEDKEIQGAGRNFVTLGQGPP